MSQLRKDFVNNRWVIVAIERAKRPNDFGKNSFFKTAEGFNFDKCFLKNISEGKQFSFHQVIKKQNELTLGPGAEKNLSLLFLDYKKKILKAKQNEKSLKYLAIFKNYKLQTRLKALRHNNANLIGLPEIPESIKNQLKNGEKYYQKNKSCFYCDLILHEIAKKERLVLKNKNFIALSPFASRFPFETWILPRKHSGEYSDINSQQLRDLALIFKKVFLQLKKVLGDFPYAYILRNRPLLNGQKNLSLSYHWYIEIIPLLTHLAGFEWGTGFYINPTFPELAAKYLRKAGLSKNNSQKKGNSNSCPFCYGNESLTPPENDADRPGKKNPNSPGWLVRVVPNKFPVLKRDILGEKEKNQFFEKRAGIGFHEVIIETPDHSKQLVDLSGPEIERVIKTYRRRFLFWAKDKRFKYILIFKNHGLTAGASLEHSHSQLICLPVIPLKVKEEIKLAQKYFYQNKECFFCALFQKEKISQKRVIAQNNYFLAYCPDRARVPFEVTIMPGKHCSDFSRINSREIKSLAAILKEVLGKSKKYLGDCPYNFFIHSHPVNTTGQSQRYFHWHVEFLPKLGQASGFEQSTHNYFNFVLPEETVNFFNKKDK